MLATLVAVLCSHNFCQEHILGQYGYMECAIHGQVIASDYIRQNDPNAKLERYKCAIGEYKKAVPL